MRNENLVADYLKRAEHRLASVELLFERKDYADTVREAQETVELCLKAVLRHAGIEVPRIHDVSEILIENKSRLAKPVQAEVEKLAKISKSLRRDRELAFYGSEDLTPSDFYSEDDGREALRNLKFVYKVCRGIL